MPKLPDPVLIAIPLFLVTLAWEMWAARTRRPDDYEFRDTMASLSMGVGNLVAKVLFGSVVAAAFSAAWTHRIHTFPSTWGTFALLFVVEDFVYYWFHRWSHERRLWWAAHVTHHSSQHYNLSTALRQTWTGFFTGSWLLWVALAWIGFPPELIAFQIGISLVYQYWIHTELIRRLPAPLEFVLNTPSHHRVHHATQIRYLDANHGGILIVWDRLFGTFVAEDDREPCRYGLTTNLGTFSPWVIAFHEWLAIARDVRRAPSLGAALQYVFGPPGWRHDSTGGTVREIKARWLWNDARPSA